MTLRQATGFVQSPKKLVGLDWTVLNFGSLSRRHKTFAANIPYRGSRGPLHLLVDSTGKHIGDALVLPDLLSQIPPEQEIGSVAADGAHDTRNCHEAIADRGGHAVIPLRRNAKPWKLTTAGALAIILGPMADSGKPRNEILRASEYLGRAIRRNWNGYHGRSSAKTRTTCMKLLGQLLMAGDFDGQIAEVQIRIAAMNCYTAFGRAATKSAR